MPGRVVAEAAAPEEAVPPEAASPAAVGLAEPSTLLARLAASPDVPSSSSVFMGIVPSSFGLPSSLALPSEAARLPPSGTGG
eukprot:9899569-Alexandrium_andersonii.AAC.1